jgi:hypothetical protein
MSLFKASEFDRFGRLDGFNKLDEVCRSDGFGRFGMNSRIVRKEELWNARCVE